MTTSDAGLANDDPLWERIDEVLSEAERLGMVGGAHRSIHMRQARALARVAGAPNGRVLDLGSGGGLPGLILAALWPEAPITLLDGSVKRAKFLESAVDKLGCGTRIDVAEGRAEELAHDPDLRGVFDLVVARSFGPPAVVAECAGGFLRTGGRLVVSEPPDSDGARWAHDTELATLGYRRDVLDRDDGFGFQVLTLVEPCPWSYPRHVGIPAKRPLF